MQSIDKIGLKPDHEVVQNEGDVSTDEQLEYAKSL